MSTSTTSTALISRMFIHVPTPSMDSKSRRVTPLVTTSNIFGHRASNSTVACVFWQTYAKLVLLKRTTSNTSTIPNLQGPSSKYDALEGSKLTQKNIPPNRKTRNTSFMYIATSI